MGRWWFLALGILLGVACVATPLSPSAPGRAPKVIPTPSPSLRFPLPTAPPSPPSPPPRSVPPGLPSVADIVERVRPGVVSIAAEVMSQGLFGPVGGRSVGTGVIFDPKGYVVTNNHVVEGARRILVTLFNGRTVRAQVVGTDPPTDLAVLKMEEGNYPAIPLGNAEQVRVGDWAIAIGNALALPGGPTVTLGIVSAVNRIIPVGDRIYYDLIQTDAAINEGNSGGPLVNLNGEVIGINTAIVREAQGIGFAVSTFTVVPVIQSILEHGRVRWPWLGVLLSDITSVKALELELPVTEGVLVEQVVRGSPAFRAGIREGDIITALNQDKVATVRDLQRLLRTVYEVGDTVMLTVLRGRQRTRVEVTLEEMPRR